MSLFNDIAFSFDKVRIKYFKDNEEVTDEIFQFKILLFDSVLDFKEELRYHNFNFDYFQKELEYYNMHVCCCKNGIDELYKRGFITDDNIDMYRGLAREFSIVPHVMEEKECYKEIKDNVSNIFTPIAIVSSGKCCFDFVDRVNDPSKTINYNGRSYKYVIVLYDYDDLLK